MEIHTPGLVLAIALAVVWLVRFLTAKPKDRSAISDATLLTLHVALICAAWCFATGVRLP